MTSFRKQEYLHQVKVKVKLGESGMEDSLEGGAHNTMFNVIILTKTTKRASFLFESKSAVRAPLIEYRLSMCHMEVGLDFTFKM